MAGKVKIGGGNSVDVEREINENPHPTIQDSAGGPTDRVRVTRFDTNPPTVIELDMIEGTTVEISW